MNILNINESNTTKQVFSEEELYENIFNEKSLITRAKYINHLRKIARSMGAKEDFETMIRAYEKVEKSKSYKQVVEDDEEAMTRFTSKYPALKTGKWIVDDEGIRTLNKKGDEEVVAHEPITIVKKSRCIQTGNEGITLAYHNESGWREITVPRDVVCVSRKMQDLSGVGFPVTSSSATQLVKYFVDMEHLNKEIIPVEKSTMKMGWIGDQFLPYSNAYVFHTEDLGLKKLYQSISSKGEADEWIAKVKELRSECKDTFNFLMAGSFASVLVEPLNALPFLVNIYGTSGTGKSVATKVAASIWAKPDNSFIGDFESTDVNVEIKADFLNNLPIILDDTSKVSQHGFKDFENMVYQIASGKGRSRSNVSLGIDRERTWKLCALTNGERPLTSLCKQGGAMARTLEMQVMGSVFENPKEVSRFAESNYGSVGKMFIEIIKNMSKQELEELYKAAEQKIVDAVPNAMGKQVASMAVVLVADKIATDSIFKDGNYISMDTVADIIKTEDAVCDYVQLYYKIVDFLKMNKSKFDGTGLGEQYGFMSFDHTVKFYVLGFEKVCASLGYKNPKDFIAWGIQNGAIIADKNRTVKNTKLPKEVAERYAKEHQGETVKQLRCIWFKKDWEQESNTAPTEVEIQENSAIPTEVEIQDMTYVPSAEEEEYDRINREMASFALTEEEMEECVALDTHIWDEEAVA